MIIVLVAIISRAWFNRFLFILYYDAGGNAYSRRDAVESDAGTDRDTGDAV